MLAAAIVALVIANSPFFEPFEEFWHTHVVVGVGGFIGEMSLAHIINDIFMAVFFLLVGLEIKYEMTVGELTNIRQAAAAHHRGRAAAFWRPSSIYSSLQRRQP